MTTRQLEFGSATFFGLAACIGVFLAFYNNTPKVVKTYALPSTVGIESPISTPVARSAPVLAPKEQIFSQPSPNGAKKVMLSVVSGESSTKIYTVTTADSDNNGQIRVYSVTLPESENISIPFNTFSPDNKYFFVIHSKDGINEALAFRTNGEPMTDTEPYFKIAETFKLKEIKNPYKETTGWASETLLIVNTTPEENGGKQSYWFEVPSKAIIGLSTQFYD